jgi:hypothetical protein
MATKSDFSQPEWQALVKGLAGAGMLVSLSDRDLTDSFGEAKAMANFLAAQHVAASSQLIREISSRPGNPFGFTASPDRIRAETMAALGSSITTLTAKSPDDVQAYRDVVLGVAHAVAIAKGGGESAIETEMIEQIRTALDAA